MNSEKPRRLALRPQLGENERMVGKVRNATSFTNPGVKIILTLVNNFLLIEIFESQFLFNTRAIERYCKAILREYFFSSKICYLCSIYSKKYLKLKLMLFNKITLEYIFNLKIGISHIIKKILRTYVLIVFSKY